MCYHMHIAKQILQRNDQLLLCFVQIKITSSPNNTVLSSASVVSSAHTCQSIFSWLNFSVPLIELELTIWWIFFLSASRMLYFYGTTIWIFLKWSCIQDSNIQYQYPGLCMYHVRSLTQTIWIKNTTIK